MKKTLLIAFTLLGIFANAQKDGNKNEIKVNFAYMIAGLPEISYERIIDETSSAGISAAFSIEDVDNMHTRYIISPYYRFYFGKGKARGFFIEANAAMENQKYKDYYYDYNQYSEPIEKTLTTTNFGLGAAVGAKFLNKRDYIGEIYGGMGRLFGTIDTGYFSEFYPRLGINIGKRF